MANPLIEDPPTDDSNDRWLEDNARLFLQICNSINGKVLTLINHCEFVKELMDYLEFLYSGKGNISRIFKCVNPFISQRNKIGRLQNFLWNIKRHMMN